MQVWLELGRFEGCAEEEFTNVKCEWGLGEEARTGYGDVKW